MKNNRAEKKKNYQGLFSTLTLSLSMAAMLVLYQNCGGSLNGQETRTASSGGGPSTSSVPEKVGITVGVNSFEATYTNMKVITGIEDGSCDQAYQEGRNSLPTSNDITTLGAAGQGASAKIAACLCRQAVSNDVNGGRTRLMPGANLNSTPLAAGDKNAIVDGMMAAAWGKDNQDVAPESKTILLDTIGELETNGATGVQAAFGVCTTTLASLGTSLL